MQLQHNPPDLYPDTLPVPQEGAAVSLSLSNGITRVGHVLAVRFDHRGVTSLWVRCARSTYVVPLAYVTSWRLLQDPTPLTAGWVIHDLRTRDERELVTHALGAAS